MKKEGTKALRHEGTKGKKDEGGSAPTAFFPPCLRAFVPLCLFIVLAFAVSSFGADKVRMTLNWVPEPEFGGIYSAKTIGAFSKHDLDVEIVPGGAGAPTWQQVANGQTDFAVASADEVMIARSKGADVVAVFATYQTCPQGIMCHAARGFKEIGDVFRNPGTVAMEPGLPYVKFLENKFGFEKVNVVAYDGGIGTFLNKPDFSQQCFITSEPLAAKKKGSDPQVFLIADAGYNPYTAVVITSGKVVKEHADRVQNMVAALREGWRAYLDDPKKANGAMGELNPDMDAETFAQAAEAQKPLIETDETKKEGLGSMTEDRWDELGKQLVDLKVIDKAPAGSECFVQEKK